LAGPDDPFGALDGHRYMVLTTFRKSGVAVPTTVWFARQGDRLFVFTAANSGKVKRLRNGPRATVAPSDFKGRRKGPEIGAVGRVLDEAEADVAERAIAAKYGWQYRLYGLLMGRSSAGHVFLEIRPEAKN
jgi:uncharacterized protein